MSTASRSRPGLLGPRAALTASLALLVTGLLVDLSTTQTLVVAILYDAPIALSGLTMSRRVTYLAIAFALLANVAAAWVNADAAGSWFLIPLLNRALAALSVLLVGVLTLALRDASARLIDLRADEAGAERERALRLLAVELSEVEEADALLERAAVRLRDLLRADAVVVAALDDHRIAAPRVASPEGSDFAPVGGAASWAVDCIPGTDRHALTVRTGTGPVTVGTWRRRDGPPLYVLAHRAQEDEAALVLAEALRGLEPILERTLQLERLRDGARQPADRATGGRRAV